MAFVPNASYAEDRFWVCVASFKDEATARSHVSAVTYDFSGDLSIIVGQSAWGERHRVVLGPFAGIGDAQTALTDAQRRQPDAWIVTADTGAVADDPGSYSSSYDLSYDRSYDSSDDASYDTSYDAAYDSSFDSAEVEDLDRDETGYGNLAPGIQSRPQGAPTPSDEPPTQAPAGYHAHELRRTDTDD